MLRRFNAALPFRRQNACSHAREKYTANNVFSVKKRRGGFGVLRAHFETRGIPKLPPGAHRLQQ